MSKKYQWFGSVKPINGKSGESNCVHGYLSAKVIGIPNELDDTRNGSYLWEVYENGNRVASGSVLGAGEEIVKDMCEMIMDLI